MKQLIKQLMKQLLKIKKNNNKIRWEIVDKNTINILISGYYDFILLENNVLKKFGGYLEKDIYTHKDIKILLKDK